MAETFRTFIARLKHRHGTSSAIAEAIGMSLSAFSRGVRLEGSFGVEKCLEIAKLAGEEPSRVLRLAKKERIADLIEELYGPERELYGRAREVGRRWLVLNSEEAKEAVYVLLAALAAASTGSESAALQQRRHSRRA
jgi:hypothetical protein